MKLSLLDFFCPPGDSIKLATLADSVGYHRYWIGEHHTERQCANPLMLAGLIAGTTVRIRVGTGAASLTLRPPSFLAEDARLLEYFFPSRLDLGVAPAASIERPDLVEEVTGRPPPPRLVYEARLRSLHLQLVGRRADAETHKQEYLYLRPIAGPPLWVIGVSAESAALAGNLGVGFCSSLYFGHRGTPERVRAGFLRYRDAFKPSREFAEPHTMLVIAGFCLDDEEALDRSLSERRAFLRRQETDPSAVSELEPAGGPAACVAKMREIAALVGADEVMYLPLIDNLSQNEKALPGLAEAWRLHIECAAKERVDLESLERYCPRRS